MNPVSNPGVKNTAPGATDLTRDFDASLASEALDVDARSEAYAATIAVEDAALAGPERHAAADMWRLGYEDALTVFGGHNRTATAAWLAGVHAAYADRGQRHDLYENPYKSETFPSGKVSQGRQS
jgi:hypothetical protein